MVYICQLLVHLLLQSKVITHHQEATDILEWKKRTLFRVSIYVFVWHSKLRNSIAGYIHRPHLLSIRYPIHQRSPSCYPLQEVVCVEGFKYQGSLTDEMSLQKLSIFIQFIRQFCVLVNAIFLSRHAKLTCQSFRYKISITFKNIFVNTFTWNQGNLVLDFHFDPPTPIKHDGLG